MSIPQQAPTIDHAKSDGATYPSGGLFALPCSISLDASLLGLDARRGLPWQVPVLDVSFEG